ncbi:hypothetical protein [Escherichia coli]|uniref:hypothetical protein n=1 Tax=Escherichia coli TaxID=562 RepID=UPI001C4070CE|nr:hypothetical protein [Escherichia coli]
MKREKVIRTTAPFVFIFIFALLISYIQSPGYILWGDSYIRWNFAKSISINGFFNDYKSMGFDNWHNTFPTILQSLSWRIAESITIFSFLQAFVYISTFFLLLNCFIGRSISLFVSLLFFIFPINAAYSVMNMPDVMIVPFIILSALVFTKSDKIKQKAGNTCYVITMILLFLMSIWTRPSFAVTAPVYGWIICSNKKLKPIFAVAITIFAALTMNIWDSVLNVKVYSPASVGMAAEVVGVSKMSDGNFCNTCLDFVGNTSLAREHYDNTDAGKMLWDKTGGLIPEKVAAISNEKTISGLYKTAIFSETKKFLLLKLDKALALLGISGPVKLYSFYTPSDYDRLSELCGGCYQSTFRYSINEVSIYLSSLLYFPVHPWLMMVLSLGSACFVRKEQRGAALFITVLGIAYYASFILNMQRVEFRYFYPSFVLFSLVIILGIKDVLIKLTTQVGSSLSS